MSEGYYNLEMGNLVEHFSSNLVSAENSIRIMKMLISHLEKSEAKPVSDSATGANI